MTCPGVVSSEREGHVGGVRSNLNPQSQGGACSCACMGAPGYSLDYHQMGADIVVYSTFTGSILT